MPIISNDLVLQSRPKRPTIFTAFTQRRYAELRGFWQHGPSRNRPRGCSVDLEVVQGDDMRLIVTVRDQNGQLIDISGASEITYAVAKRFGAVPELTKTLSGNTLSVTNDNTFVLDIEATESGALAASSYHHECEIITSGGLTYTVLQGRFRVLPQIIT